MRRTLQTVAIPVFQFGIFSENDLSFFAGPNFNFGGRVHTNVNLYLAEGNGATLTMADRVTAVGEVIRTNLSNGWDANTQLHGNRQGDHSRRAPIARSRVRKAAWSRVSAPRPTSLSGPTFRSAPTRATSGMDGLARGGSICRWFRKAPSRSRS